MLTHYTDVRTFRQRSITDVFYHNLHLFMYAFTYFVGAKSLSLCTISYSITKNILSTKLRVNKFTSCYLFFYTAISFSLSLFLFLSISPPMAVAAVCYLCSPVEVLSRRRMTLSSSALTYGRSKQSRERRLIAGSGVGLEDSGTEKQQWQVVCRLSNQAHGPAPRGPAPRGHHNNYQKLVAFTHKGGYICVLKECRNTVRLPFNVCV